jgi:acetyl-CoA acyltransferase
MERAVIVDVIRTPGGKRYGQLSGWHPADLVAQALNGVLERHDIDPAIIDDVFMGCVSQVGAQSTNIGRSAVLAAGWPEQIPATTIDRQCGSSQQAVHFAAQSIMAGVNDVVIAAGVECMSTVPMSSSMIGNLNDPYGPLARARYADQVSYGEKGLVMQGTSAEMVADTWALTREELDTYSLRSHQRAAAARDAGRFDDELITLEARWRDRDDINLVRSEGKAVSDEGIRSTSLEQLANLKPAFHPSGKITGGNSSQITDGASAAVIMSERLALSMGLRPRAILTAFSVVGVDPIAMLTGPIPATKRLLEKVALSIDEIDLFEVNEAFASVALAWIKEMHADDEKVNVNGGGIALGHPLGASGVKLLASLVHELERRQGRYGLLTMCEGGGMANATLIERYV